MLNKVEDKYNRDGVNFPTNLDDITTFEANSQICVKVFGYSEDKNEINPNRLGHIPFIKKRQHKCILDKGRARQRTVLHTFRNLNPSYTQPQQQIIKS